MDNREVVLITGAYVAVVVLVAVVMLAGGACVAEHIVNWDIGDIALFNTGTLWEANI